MIRPSENDLINKIIEKYGLCTCDKIYTSRNLTAPDCPFHSTALEEAMIEYAELILKTK